MKITFNESISRVRLGTSTSMLCFDSRIRWKYDGGGSTAEMSLSDATIDREMLRGVYRVYSINGEWKKSARSDGYLDIWLSFFHSTF